MTHHSWILILLIVFGGCVESDNGFFPNEIDAATFKVHTPEGWMLIEDQGIDTYVGRIAGEADTIYFDQGYLAFRGLDDIRKDERTIYIRKTQIGGIPAVIEKTELSPQSLKRVRLSVFIEADDQRKNHLYVHDPSSLQSEIMLLKIMHSHKFK